MGNAKDMSIKVFVALGGNLGDVAATFDRVLEKLAANPGVSDLCCSNYYRTTPVEMRDPWECVNAVCCFHTHLSREKLFRFLQDVEVQCGKMPKPKESSRRIDLDLLFYGTQAYSSPDLEIPHPKWKERLFVLRPLLDLTHAIEVENHWIDLDALVHSFPNPHGETVVFLTSPKTIERCIDESANGQN